MVRVTERAKEELRRILLDMVDEPGMSLRLVPGASGQFGLVPDVEKAGDQVVEHEQIKVLLIDEELAGFFERVTVDCQETPEGPQLVIARRG